MILIRRPICCSLVLATCGLASVAVAAPAGKRAPDIEALLRRQPMIFFVAKGSPNACGPGCSEWIAADGVIDPGAGQRLRELLGAMPGRNLPIFFNSQGGRALQALMLGGILREHRMTAGVGRTIPADCRHNSAIDDACLQLMQSRREHTARLVTGGAYCLSGCVYALVGGAVRQVARDTQLGIHSARVPAISGHSPATSALYLEDIHRLLKRYVIGMGIDPALFDAAAKVSADRVRYLSRDEIARFGIETRGFYETPWMPYKENAKRPVVVKSVTQGTGRQGVPDQQCSNGLRRRRALDMVRLSAGAAVERDRGGYRHSRCRWR